MGSRIGYGSGWGSRWLVLAVGLAAAGCGDDGKASTSGPPQRGGGPGGQRIVAVETAVAEVGTIARNITVSGVVEPIRTIGVNSQLAGALLSVQAQEGDAVREGAVLARLDDRELQAQLRNAEAAFQVATAALERAERLRERKVITEPEYERDRAAFAAARSQLDQLRTRVGYATVLAPATGVILEKRVESGDVVAPQTRLFTVADVSTLVVRVQVSELDVVELEPGDRVSVALDAYPGRELQGRIRRVFPSADPATRLVPVEVALEGESARLARPGFLARVTFALGALNGAVLVPASAIVGGGAGQAVFVVEAGTAARREVEAGLTSAGRVQIRAGIQPGEVVVTVGNNQLSDGAQVRVVGAGAAGEAAPASAAREQDAPGAGATRGAAAAQAAGAPGRQRQEGQ